MIEKFVQIFDAHKDELQAIFAARHPNNYSDIVEQVVILLNAHEERFGRPDPKRIHVIDDGEYQGTLLFVIGEEGYQPDDYWAVKVSYGSCSGCDTLESIRGYSDELPTEQQVKDYMTLALHIVQGLKEI